MKAKYLDEEDLRLTWYEQREYSELARNTKIARDTKGRYVKGHAVVQPRNKKGLFCSIPYMCLADMPLSYIRKHYNKDIYNKEKERREQQTTTKNG